MNKKKINVIFKSYWKLNFWDDFGVFGPFPSRKVPDKNRVENAIFWRSIYICFYAFLEPKNEIGGIKTGKILNSFFDFLFHTGPENCEPITARLPGDPAKTEDR